MPLTPDDVDSEQRRKDGYRAALIAKNVDGETVEEKPFGQTSEEVYPYTYWYIVGWNDAAAELATAAKN